MESKKDVRLLKNERGQGMIEYVLLLVVISALASLVLKSSAFKQFLGKDSSFFEAIARRLEFSYRYGHNGDDDSFGTNYGSQGHELYQRDGSTSRFFGPREPYGN